MRIPLLLAVGIAATFVTPPSVSAQLGKIPWVREDFTVTQAALPLAAPAGNPRLIVEHAQGTLRIVDNGKRQGDMVTCSKPWCADPQQGAGCRAMVKVLRCDGLAGVMIAMSDGVHEDILTLHEDRIELYRAKMSHAMSTTDRFHLYELELRGTDLTVSVDGKQVINAAGVFTFPAHNRRNRFSFGSGASASQGESLWKWVAWTDGLQAARDRHPVVAGAEQVTIFKQQGVYAVFPSLHWTNGHERLFATFAKKKLRTHFETAGSTTGIMESTDSGRSWHAVEALPAATIGPRPAATFTMRDGASVRISQHWRRFFPPERRVELAAKYRTVTVDAYKPGWFATNSGGFLSRSDDGGKTWEWTEIRELDTFSSCSSPWSFLQLQDGRVLRSFMVRANANDSGDVHVAITSDGRTADVVRVMGDPKEQLRFTEETLVHETSEGVIWLLTRVEGGDDRLWQALSRDGGRSWTAAKTAIEGHPPSGLVKLKDGRLVLTYGYRHPPYGVRAVMSSDEGITWDTDNVIVLRNDGAGYDLGYPRSTLLPDGTIVTVYYFVTDGDPITHIACTRWRPPAKAP